MRKGKAISLLLGLLVVLPIWYFLLYRILSAINASELMWFLYWVYLPVGIIVQFISKIAED
jgi:hypothetical protein